MLGRILFVLLLSTSLSAQTYKRVSLGAALALDTFTDTNGTALEDHTSDSGHSWTKSDVDTMSISSNQAISHATTGSDITQYYWVNIADSTNYKVSVRWNLQDPGASGYEVGVIFRRTSAGNGYRLYFQASDGFNQLSLNRLTSGGSSQVELDSDTYAEDSSVWYRYDVYCLDDLIIAQMWDDDQDTLVLAFEATDATNYGDVGIQMREGNLSLGFMDDFQVNKIYLNTRRQGLLRNQVTH